MVYAEEVEWRFYQGTGIIAANFIEMASWATDSRLQSQLIQCNIIYNITRLMPQDCGSIDNEISTFLAKWIVKNWQWNPDLIKAPSSAHKARYLKAQIGWMQHKIIDLKNSLQSEKFTNTQYNDFDCKQQLVIEYMQIVTIKSSMLCSWQWNLLTSTKYKHSICDLC